MVFLSKRILHVMIMHSMRSFFLYFIYLMKTISRFNLCARILGAFSIIIMIFMTWKGASWKESWGWQTVNIILRFSLPSTLSYLSLCHNWNFPFPSAARKIEFSLEIIYKTVCRSYSSIMNDDYQIMAWLPIENLIKKFLYCFSL